MSEQDSLRSTKVVVGQDRFQIQTDLSEQELQAIASYVDAKLSLHMNPVSRTDPRKQLVLMALDIASELFETRRRLSELETFKGEALRTAHRLNTLLEEPGEASCASPTPHDERPSAAQIFLD